MNMIKIAMLFGAFGLIGQTSPVKADLTQDSEIILNWAEHDYVQFFPQPDTTKIFDFWRYRYYPATHTYIGLDTRNAGIYVSGGAFGSAPLFINTTPTLLTEAIGKSQQGLTADSSTTWPNKTVDVCWEGGTTNPQEQAWVKDAVTNTWERESALKFIGWGACTASSKGIRILISDERPHTVALGTKLDGVSNGMVLNFTFAKWAGGLSCQDGGNIPAGFDDPIRIASTTEREFCIKAIGVHEFGHALGFSHENPRDDGPGCDATEKGDTAGNWKVTPYDLFSIMNYCNPKWNGNGNLSAQDIEGVISVYGRNPFPMNLTPQYYILTL